MHKPAESTRAQQQAAFAAFMLGGSAAATAPLPSPGAAADRDRRTARTFARLRRAFALSLRDWLDLDGQALEVVRSVANLRERLWLSSRALAAAEDRQSDSAAAVAGADWRRHGYRGGTAPSRGAGAHLTVADLRLTLSDELRQHERMLALARRTVAALGPEQDSLGRRLEDLLLWAEQAHSNDTDSGAAGNLLQSAVEFAVQIETYRQVFVAASQELYRKQLLLQEVLDSVHDGLLYGATCDSLENRDVEPSDSPKQVARRCADVWPRSSPQSCLYLYMDDIDRLDAEAR